MVVLFPKENSMKNYLSKFVLLASVSLGLFAGLAPKATSTNESDSMNDEGHLVKPFDEGIDAMEFNKIPKATDHVLVKLRYKDNMPSQTFLRSYGIGDLEELSPSSNWYNANLLEGNNDLVSVVSHLRASRSFEMVDYDYIASGDGFAFADGASNPGALLCSLFDTANVFKAWEHMKKEGLPGGDPSVTIAVIDTGVDYNHEDLKANMWTNPNEIPNNGIDDDGDGYVDDVYGANTLDQAQGADAGDPMDDHGHGTHVAGIIAGANNNKGSLGIAYNCKIMAIKAGTGSGYFTNSSIAKAVLYAYEHGADVINMSFSGTGVSYAVQEALETAYERCILVAAAGNDGLNNEKSAHYPAAFPFVLGVMSETAFHKESRFTNYDGVADNVREYEVYAPGESIFSSLPGNKYAQWSGTSMAAPVVSGAAALLRSLHLDRKIFPTKAAMAALASNLGHSVSCYNPISHGFHNLPKDLDIYQTLTANPKPEVSLYDSYTFDNIGEDDNDGIIDAGETINLGVVLKNKGGVAKGVEVSIDTTSDAGLEDRYIKPSISKIQMKDIGTYSLQDCDEIKDATDTQKVIGVKTPLQFKVSNDCPNDYICDIHVKMTWKNGLDEEDKTTYSSSDSIQIVVQRGVILPKVISKDTTLTKDKYYILNTNVLVEEGVVLTIDPGVTIQWYASSTSKYQKTYEQGLSLINNGTIIAKGETKEHILFKPSDLFSSYPVLIKTKTMVFEYCDFVNLCDCSNESGPYPSCYCCTFKYSFEYLSYDNRHRSFSRLTFDKLENCTFEWVVFEIFRVDVCVDCSFYNCSLPGMAVTEKMAGNYFYNANFQSISIFDYGFLFIDMGDTNSHYINGFDGLFENNTFVLLDETDCRISCRQNRNFENPIYSIPFSHNTFYDIPNEKIDDIIRDYYDDGTSAIIDYSDGLNKTDYSVAYPIVLDAHFEDAEGVRQETVGASTYKCIVTMSRDMDTSIPLKVEFGSVYPYADYTVEGKWKEGSKTIWEGSFTFNSKFEGGINRFLIYNGRADDCHSLELVRDYRLTFKIDMTSAQSMNLQASSDINGVKLNWFQDDYPTIAGYNLYKSTAKDGQYTKVNKQLINYDVTEYLDKEVEPGVTYFYNFTVVLTDMSESKPSGKTSVTTYDSLAPNVYHTPISVAYLGFNLMVSATVTDNVGAESVALFYRVKGEEAFQQVAMQANNSKYTAMIVSSYITDAGLEYYIDAFDGINHTYSASASAPHQVIVQSKVTENEKGDVDGNGVIDLYDALLTIRAANDLENLTSEQFERADLDGNSHLTANEALLILQYANGSITSFKEYL